MVDHDHVNFVDWILQNVKQKSNMNEIMDIYLNVQIFKCLDIEMSRY